MTTLKDLKARFLKDPAVRKEYDALDEEFALIATMAKARPWLSSAIPILSSAAR